MNIAIKNKHQKLWLATRKEWIKLHPPNHQGYYICWIGHDWVKAEDMELDHILSRSRRPDLRYVLSNLAPSCHKHNSAKGSREFTPKTTEIELDDVW